MNRNLFIDLQVAASNLWNERKGLDWAKSPVQRKQAIKRIVKQIAEIKDIVIELETKELIFLKDFFNSSSKK